MHGTDSGTTMNMIGRRITVIAACTAAAALALSLLGCTPAGDPNVRQLGPDLGQPPPGRAADEARARPRDEFERSGDAPINADTRFAAGQLAETQELPARAEEQYRKALALNPNHRGALFRLGVLYAKQKRYGEAIDAWNRYVRATNDDATGYANLGFCLELAGRTEEAEIAYRKGIQRDPTNAPCRVNYGLLLARHDRINEAMLEMQAVLPEAQVHYNLASVYEGMGRREQAKAEYRKALAAEPHMAEAQARLDALH
jgi:tetratricopeptide (TPR) repeat protein